MDRVLFLNIKCIFVNLQNAEVIKISPNKFDANDFLEVIKIIFSHLWGSWLVIFWFESGFEPSSKLFGTVAIRLLVVGDESLALVEPVVQFRIELEIIKKWSWVKKIHFKVQSNLS